MPIYTVTVTQRITRVYQKDFDAASHVEAEAHAAIHVEDGIDGRRGWRRRSALEQIGEETIIAEFKRA